MGTGFLQGAAVGLVAFAVVLWRVSRAPDKARTFERGFPWFVIDVFRQYSENGADYLVALLRHAEAVGEAPGEWMPWNYKQALAAADAPPAS